MKQNQRTKHVQMNTVILYLTKTSEADARDEMTSSANETERMRCPHIKERANSKWIKGLNIKPETARRKHT